MNGFLPGKEYNKTHASKKKETAAGMLLPMAVLAFITLLLGILPNPLIQYVREIAAVLL